MKAPDFLYHRVSSIDEAVKHLSHFEGNARILAGGQSLLPMLNMRLWRPTALIDINGVEGLSQIDVQGEETVLGALVRHVTVETSPVIAERLPLLATMIRYVGDRQIRNRGTIGGSLVQGDPSAEMPLGCLVLGAKVRVKGPNGMREIAMEQLYEGSYAASLAAHELLTAVVFPRHPAHCFFLERCRRHNDFAILSIAAVGERAADGRWSGIRLGLGGVHDTPILATEVAAQLEGTALTDAQITQAAEGVLQVVSPPSDMRASAQYRMHLISVYVRRALEGLRLAVRSGSRDAER